MEPSYYSWMQNGDFPLYTKKVLEKLWNQYRDQRKEQRTITAVKENINTSKKEVKSNEPVKSITNDMLASLKDKFGK